MAKWATTHGLTNAAAIATAEFDHYRTQARLLAAALGEETYRRLLDTYEADVMRGGSGADPIAERFNRQDQRPSVAHPK